MSFLIRNSFYCEENPVPKPHGVRWCLFSIFTGDLKTESHLLYRNQSACHAVVSRDPLNVLEEGKFTLHFLSCESRNKLHSAVTVHIDLPNYANKRKDKAKCKQLIFVSFGVTINECHTVLLSL
jgi:hypothetical protein